MNEELKSCRRCSACGEEKPVSEMKTCMHNQLHRYVCDTKCMNDFYNPPKKASATAEPSPAQDERSDLLEAIHQYAFEVGGTDDGDYDLTPEELDEVVRRAIEPFEDVLRSLACSLGAGGYNAKAVDPAVFEEKIRWGIDQLATRPAQAEQTEQRPVPDAVWEALQRMIETTLQLGPHSREDAQLVTRYRDRYRLLAAHIAQTKVEQVTAGRASMSKEVKRYTPEHCESGGEIWAEMQEDSEGAWVHYDALLAERDRLRSCLRTDVEAGDSWKREAQELRAEVEALRGLLRETSAVAITMLYDNHQTDTLTEFSVAELEAVVNASEPLQGVSVESVYRRAWDAAMAAKEAGNA